MKPFILIWNAGQTETYQQELLDYFDSKREIQNWFVPFVGTVLIIGDHGQTPSSLSNLIHEKFPKLLIAVTPADTQMTNGWMPTKFWELLKDPKPSGRWSSQMTLLEMLSQQPKKT